MKITLFEVPGNKRELFNIVKKYPGIEVEFVEDALTDENFDKYVGADIVSTFIYSRLNEKVLNKFNKLKLIATRSTGFDHIDYGYCRKRGILVCNVPNYAANTVAEYVFGFLLNISRKMHETFMRTRNGNFSKEGLCGFDLKGKTMGIIGLGAIGRSMVQIGKGFGMRLIGYDIVEDIDWAQGIGFEYKSLMDVLRESDIISLNVPATAVTEKMIGKGEYAVMKDGVILINTARGSILDCKELIHALKEGKVGAVGLDVVPGEKLFYRGGEISADSFEEKEVIRVNQTLLEMPNVYMTPHNAFNTREALDRIIQVTNDNIISFLEGKPKNIIN